MKMKLNAQKIKAWRDDRNWSQEDLAELSGVSVRTVQRIENGNATSRDSAASIAAAFNVDLNTLTLNINGEVEKATVHQAQKSILGLKLSVWIHLAAFIFVVFVWVVIDLVGSLHFGRPMSYWFAVPALWWFVGLLGHAMALFIVIFANKTDQQIKALEK